MNKPIIGKLIEWFEEQPANKKWTKDQIVGRILSGLACEVLTRNEEKWLKSWAQKQIFDIPEDMQKSFVHERPMPTTLPPTERVVSKSEQKRRTIQEGARKKGGINPPPTSPKPNVKPSPQKPMRPALRHITEGKNPTELYPAIRVGWTESERGWGQRPDGYSLHLTREDSEAYIKEYWDKMPAQVPDEYSRPEDPKVIDVNAKILREIKKSKNGIRRYDR